MVRSNIGEDKSRSGLFDHTAYMDSFRLLERFLAANLPASPPLSSPLLQEMNTSASISPSEIRAALNKCPNGSAPGLDRIPYEALKYGGDLPIECLSLVFRISWRLTLHPSRWDKALITPLYKGGDDPNDVNKYRAITLLCTSSKLETL